MVEGAAVLEDAESSDVVVYQVIQHPLMDAEMEYFLVNLDAVVRAGEKYPEFWSQVSDADERMRAMRGHPLWEESGVDYEDFVAAFIKLNYLYEHLQDPLSAKQAWENVERLRRTSVEKGDAEAAAAVSRMKQIASAIEAMEQAGSMKLYQKNWREIERALDRFKSMGEQ